MVYRVQFWREENPIFSPAVTQQMTRLISPINPLCADQVKLLTVLTTLVVNLPTLPPFKHKPFSTFNYAQDFETRVKESIKKYFEFEVGCPHEKWPVLSDVWYFQAFVTTLGYMSLPAVQTVRKEDEVVMKDWIENFRPVWQQIVRLTAEAKRKFLCRV